ncbi:MAG: hypothetical protein L0226_14275 [Acidobacteria bacterium]|nr:hypothetical protein [Acidobacteriota bacterium]
MDFEIKSKKIEVTIPRSGWVITSHKLHTAANTLLLVKGSRNFPEDLIFYPSLLTLIGLVFGLNNFEQSGPACSQMSILLDIYPVDRHTNCLFPTKITPKNRAEKNLAE